MPRFIEEGDRSQATMFPELLDDYISEENQIRFIDAFVQELPLQQLDFHRVEPCRTGRLGYIRRPY